MTAKLLTSVGCLLLLAAALTPSVLGHSERAPITGDASGFPGTFSGRYSLPGTVSGRYVGAAGPAIALEAYAWPAGTRATGAILYDAEVVIDGNLPVNEQDIDGFGTLAGNTGLLPNFWDDGGVGGAGHTNSYTTPQFNTPGCQGGLQVAGGTHAGTDIWVGAACDWKEVQGAVSSEETLIVCLINAVLSFNPLSPLLVEIQRFVDCTATYVTCLLNPIGCVFGGIEFCGADGVNDAIKYGYAGVGAAINPARFPAATGVTNRYHTGICAVGDETAAIFVWDTVATNGGGVNSVGSVDVYPALTGEVWTIAPLPALFPAHVQCVKATAANPVVVQTVCRNGFGGPICWPWISIWDPVNLVSIDQCLP